MEEAGDSPNVDPPSGSLILGASDDGSLVRYIGPAMGVTIGGTGSGKFTAAIAPNLLTYSGSCFVVDPSGEACAVTANARKTHHAQTVHRLDPFDETAFAPGAYVPPLATYNPLDALDPADLSFACDEFGGSIVPASPAKRGHFLDRFLQTTAYGPRHVRLLFSTISGNRAKFEQGL